MTTGARIAGLHDHALPARTGPRHLLFVDADLEASAAHLGVLVPPVAAGTADMSIAILPPQRTAGGGHGFVVRLARDGIAGLTGWRATQPLSGMRCLSRAAFDRASPLARGWGVEVGLTVDVLSAGLRIVEVPCELHHRVSGRGWRAQLHRARQYRDVWLALAVRRLRRATVAAAHLAAAHGDRSHPVGPWRPLTRRRPARCRGGRASARSRWPPPSPCCCSSGSPRRRRRARAWAPEGGRLGTCRCTSPRPVSPPPSGRRTCWAGSPSSRAWPGCAAAGSGRPAGAAARPRGLGVAAGVGGAGAADRAVRVRGPHQLRGVRADRGPGRRPVRRAAGDLARRHGPGDQCGGAAVDQDAERLRPVRDARAGRVLAARRGQPAPDGVGRPGGGRGLLAARAVAAAAGRREPRRGRPRGRALDRQPGRLRRRGPRCAPGPAGHRAGAGRGGPRRPSAVGERGCCWARP